MAASITSISPRRSPAPAPAPPPNRRPFRDNPRLILLGIAVLIGVLAAILTVANRSRFSPDFTSEFVLYALTAADLTMLVALVFVLARNIVKLIVERRGGLPFARFRAKLVTLLLGMTLVPAVLVLAVGSELINRSVEQWFNAPMDEILSSANQIAGDYYQERRLLVADQATRIARVLASVDLTNPDVAQLRALIAPDVASQRVQMIEVYRVGPAVGSPARLLASGRRTSGRAGAGRFQGDAIDRGARHLRRFAARGVRHSRPRRWTYGGRGGGDRLSDGRSCGALAAHDESL
jgi:two-component system nitrogen regulation sensor histidine kinase NtrY